MKSYLHLRFPLAGCLLGGGLLRRGMPYHGLYREIECVINHGLWTKVPDFDAITQLSNSRFRKAFETVDQVMPVGFYFPMCGMNLAFKPQIIPAMYFLLMGQRNWPFDRFGDIWCGIFLKKICDHLGLGVKSGCPIVEHQDNVVRMDKLAKGTSGIRG